MANFVWWQFKHQHCSVWIVFNYGKATEPNCMDSGFSIHQLFGRTSVTLGSGKFTFRLPQMFFFIHRTHTSSSWCILLCHCVRKSRRGFVPVYRVFACIFYSPKTYGRVVYLRAYRVAVSSLFYLIARLFCRAFPAGRNSARELLGQFF